MTSQRLILVLAVSTVKALAGDLTIVAVGPFGQAIQGCHVEGFRPTAEEGGTRPQYSNRFHGLAGAQIPLGEYDATILCGKGEIYKRITVDHSRQFEVVALRGRTLASDHVKPKLTVKLDTPPPPGETWWIRLTGLYNGGTYTDRFAGESGEAAVTDPEPGSYLVTVLSTKGYACVREVDFVEFTKSWTFKPSGCSFGLDRFAHLVQEEDKRNQKAGPWYKDMQEVQEELQRGLQEAAAKK